MSEIQKKENGNNFAKTVLLNNGYSMPIVSLGCWKISPSCCSDQIYEAIKIGYRSFDGACDYGNEKEIGEGIQRALSEKIIESRKELFIISKLWNNYHHPKNVSVGLDKTLKDLQIDYIDLYYIHFPIPFKFVPIEEKYPPGFYTSAADQEAGKFSFEKITVLDTWLALEEQVQLGKIKSLGISNFQGVLIQDLLNGCNIKPQCLQIEHHPYLTQERLVKYAQRENIQVVAYSSFGPLSFIELNSQCALNAVPLMEHPKIVEISKTHNVSPSDVLLKWATQRNIAVIPKSSKPKRLLQNLTFDKKLTLSNMEILEISKLNENLRFNDPWEWLDQGIPTFV